MTSFVGKIVYLLFKKHIDSLAKEKLNSLALDKYINDNLFIDTTNGLELQMRGKKFIKIFAASLYEIVKEADNYVTMDLFSPEFKPMTVTIQKKMKLSPHDKAEKLTKENEKLKEEIAELKEKQ